MATARIEETQNQPSVDDVAFANLSKNREDALTGLL